MLLSLWAMQANPSTIQSLSKDNLGVIASYIPSKSIPNARLAIHKLPVPTYFISHINQLQELVKKGIAQKSINLSLQIASYSFVPSTLSSEDCSGLIKFLTSHPHISVVDVNFCQANGISKGDVKSILMHMSNVESLQLDLEPIDDDTLTLIAERFPRLTYLNLGACSLTEPEQRDISDKRIAYLLERQTQLKGLNLDFNCSTNAIKAITTYGKNLEGLSLVGCGLDDDAAKDIACHLKKLKVLNLSSNHIGNEGAQALVNALAPNLVALNIAQNNITALLPVYAPMLKVFHLGEVSWNTNELSQQYQRALITQNLYHTDKNRHFDLLARFKKGVMGKEVFSDLNSSRSRR